LFNVQCILYLFVFFVIHNNVIEENVTNSEMMFNN
jgi:hypothetical protein